MDFNTKPWNLQHIFCPKSVMQAKIARGGPIQYNLYILLQAVTEAKSFVFY